MILSRAATIAIVRPLSRVLVLLILACVLAVLRRLCTIALALSALSGCNNMPFAPQQQNQAAVTQQMQTLAQQNQEYQSRAAALDRNNQEVESLLAQSRQQVQLLNNELVATRGQLQTTTDQLLAMRTESDQLRTQARSSSPRCSSGPAPRSARTTRC